MEDWQVVEDRDTRLPLLLSPVSRISQWSDMDELVEPVRQVEKNTGTFLLDSSTAINHVCLCCDSY